ncbi:DUF2753 family protein [Bordetella genomosp. 4]|uniref:Tetratricopeptide repeat protein n=1 Tax=Bordetella genomosp. 4 TaxID=463044 RepID=A0A261TLV1_9BORD|nr:DUF2753 family protein [Bordetella genomosp. 4]OZI43020.1 hypothetical protein CAL21_19625 [Bordetella genomosp. 4]OZI50579.1 hypothetical protein CAL20_22295 [Bordetella genomosp. 4]
MVQIQPRPATVPPPATTSCLGVWQRATLRGNRAYERGDYAAALTQYRAALSLADTLPGQSDDVEAALAALVVSHHNLLTLYEQTGQFELAAAHACRAHELLHEIALDYVLPECWREAAWRHGRVTYAELLQFLQRHPDHDRARRAAALVWRDQTQPQH